MYSNEGVFLVNGKINEHNVRIRGMKTPQMQREIGRDSRNCNCMVCELRKMKSKLRTTMTIFCQCRESHQFIEQFLHSSVTDYTIQYHFWTIWWPNSFWSSSTTGIGWKTLLAWIGIGGPPKPWPASSPNLAPPDFSLCRYVKEKVYRTLFPCFSQLKTRMASDIRAVQVIMFKCIEKRPTLA